MIITSINILPVKANEETTENEQDVYIGQGDEATFNLQSKLGYEFSSDVAMRDTSKDVQVLNDIDVNTDTDGDGLTDELENTDTDGMG